MSTLYITEIGVQVHKEGQRLLVKRGADVLQDIPLIKIDRVVLVGKSVSITTPTLYALTSRNVGVYYMNSHGKFMARTNGNEHNHSRLRQLQVRACDNPERCLAIARAIVGGKIHNQRVLVMRHAEGASWASNALAQMDAMRKQLGAAQTLDELRGREGLAAREYFHLLRRIFRPPADGGTWGFDRRAYYPSTDPINALLSLGYTLLLNDLIAACQISGLDPAMGFFHAIDYNKPSMALDLEEEFRPVIVDSIVLTAINRPIFRPTDFQIASPQHDEDDDPQPQPAKPVSSEQNKHARSVYLKDTARKRFVQLYEARVNETVIYPSSGEQLTYRRIFEMQAYHMSRVILGSAERYSPFTIR